MDDFVVWLWMVVHHCISVFNPDPLFFHHYNFFKELLFVDTKIRYYFHSVKSFFKYFFLEIVWVSFITYGLSIIQIYKELFILSNLFLIRVRSPFMLSVLLNLLQRSILFIHSVCSAFLSQGNNIFAARTGFEPVIVSISTLVKADTPLFEVHCKTHSNVSVRVPTRHLTILLFIG